jgi:hypothetical protein
LHGGEVMLVIDHEQGEPYVGVNEVRSGQGLSE